MAVPEKGPGHPVSVLSIPHAAVCVLAKLLQSCLTLCNPMDRSLPDSSVHGILQARILERVAMPSSRGSSPPLMSPALAGKFCQSLMSLALAGEQTRISYVSCIGRQVLYHSHHPGNPHIAAPLDNSSVKSCISFQKEQKSCFLRSSSS